MEVYFDATPKFEPIAHRPYIRKWVREKKFAASTSHDYPHSPFLNHINRYLFYCLENNNLELAYKFRYSLEAAGYFPFYQRRFELDKAIRRAKNGSFALLEQLIDSICIEIDDQKDRKGQLLKPQKSDQCGQGAMLVAGIDEKRIRISGDLLTAFQTEKALFLPGPTDWMQQYAILYRWTTKHLEALGKDQLDAALIRRRKRHENDSDTEETKSATLKVIKLREPVKLPLIREKSPIEQSLESHEEVSYDYSGFRFSSRGEKTDSEPDESVVFLKEMQEDRYKSRFISPGMAPQSNSKSTADRPDFLAFQDKLNKPAQSAPPVLYKFNAISKSSVTKAYEDEVTKDPLVISQDSIARRTTENQEKSHFLQGSSFWKFFRKGNEEEYGYSDANSLVINQDCIDNRITNINANQTHALMSSTGEYNAFEAFDSVFIDPEDPIEEDQELWEETEEKGFDNVAYRKEIKQLYRENLGCYRKGDPSYFSLGSSRFFTEKEGNQALYQWLKQLPLTIKELYNAFREGVDLAKTEHLGEVQDYLVSRLKRSDFPSYEAWTHFETYKIEAELAPLAKSNLTQILNNEVNRVGGVSGCGSETLLNLFSPTEDKTNMSELPYIRVRQSETPDSAPFLPIQKPAQNREFLDSPSISVRTSSAYQKRHALSGRKSLHIERKTIASPKNSHNGI